MINPLKTEIKISLPIDYELLVMMTRKKDTEMGPDASDAFRDFYNRHKEYLMKISRKVCNKFIRDYGSEIVNDIFNNTFKRLYEKVDLLLLAMENHKDGDEVFFQKKLRAYLGKMANNELWLYKRQANQFNKQHVFIDDMTLMQQFDCADAEEAEEAKTGFSSIEAEAINYGLTVLTERERDILIECTRYQVDGKDLPDEVISELCERWDILKVNLRVIKHRAFKKLEKLAKSYT